VIHLMELFKAAGVIQVLDWSLFQTIKKNSYFIQVPTNQHVTEVWFKWEETVNRYTFDIQGKLIGLKAETLGD
jgi:hypothetical protein